MAQYRRNEFDVTDRINTTDPAQVAEEICHLYQALYQRDPDPSLMRAFNDLVGLYRGENPGYHACDTDYHDVQHVLDVTLAMARLMDGYKRATNDARLDEPLFRLGVIAALYHDVGYIRHIGDTRHQRGAEYTATHVSRGVAFLQSYLPIISMGEDAHVASRILHYTGYEMPISSIQTAPRYQLLGNLLGSADILAQMADRCYLEKCHDRLFPEFVLGGIARKRDEAGKEIIIFDSASDLIYKTVGFYKGASKRLEQDLGSYYVHLEKHFGGQNLYLSELEKNIHHAQQVTDKRDVSLLRRTPPDTLVDVQGNPLSAKGDNTASDP
jgi:hypothetical protein